MTVIIQQRTDGGASSEHLYRNAQFSAGYSLTVGTFILIAGRLGHVFGHERFFVGPETFIYVCSVRCYRHERTVGCRHHGSDVEPIPRASTVMVLSMTTFLTAGIIIAAVPVYQTYWAQTFVAIIIPPRRHHRPELGHAAAAPGSCHAVGESD
ncbi:hypothetical protein BKA56DRAFT_668702 [Ilyonectria sp. MPI-CAGE-AT-0026]|nr:hypothetical protein BKA56DRAFT_668702 [Ilyonectria sp. MPI-CAGE-AT-0026]